VLPFCLSYLCSLSRSLKKRERKWVPPLKGCSRMFPNPRRLNSILPPAFKEALIKLLLPPMTIISRTESQLGKTFTGGQWYKAYYTLQGKILPKHRRVRRTDRIVHEKGFRVKDFSAGTASTCNCLLPSTSSSMIVNGIFAI